jgi:hypothetical protein
MMVITLAGRIILDSYNAGRGLHCSTSFAYTNCIILFYLYAFVPPMPPLLRYLSLGNSQAAVSSCGEEPSYRENRRTGIYLTDTVPHDSSRDSYHWWYEL